MATNPPNTWNTIIDLKLPRSYNILNFKCIPLYPCPWRPPAHPGTPSQRKSQRWDLQGGLSPHSRHTHVLARERRRPQTQGFYSLKQDTKEKKKKKKGCMPACLRAGALSCLHFTSDVKAAAARGGKDTFLLLYKQIKC